MKCDSAGLNMGRTRLRRVKFDPQRVIAFSGEAMRRKKPQTILREVVAQFARAYAETAENTPRDWTKTMNLRAGLEMLFGLKLSVGGGRGRDATVKRVTLFVATGERAKAPAKPVKDSDYFLGAQTLLSALSGQQIPFRATEVLVFEWDYLCRPWLSTTAFKISIPGSDSFAVSLARRAVKEANEQASKNPFAPDSWEA